MDAKLDPGQKQAGRLRNRYGRVETQSREVRKRSEIQSWEPGQTRYGTAQRRLGSVADMQELTCQRRLRQEFRTTGTCQHDSPWHTRVADERGRALTTAGELRLTAAARRREDGTPKRRTGSGCHAEEWRRARAQIARARTALIGAVARRARSSGGRARNGGEKGGSAGWGGCTSGGGSGGGRRGAMAGGKERAWTAGE